MKIQWLDTSTMSRSAATGGFNNLLMVDVEVENLLTQKVLVHVIS
jgi:hypothetical protein